MAQLSEATKLKRQIRAKFRKKYGEESLVVISRMNNGATNKQLGEMFWHIPQQALAAYRQNFNRGVYQDFLPYLA